MHHSLPTQSASKIRDIRPVKIFIANFRDCITPEMERILGNAGYDYSFFTNNRVALDIYSKSHTEWDLIVMNIIPSDASGYNLFLALLCINPQARFLLCSNESLEDIADTDRETVRHVLIKPFTADKLLQTLSDCLVR